MCIMMVKETFRLFVMFIVGFCVYITIEVLYRSYSYPIMGLMGSILFILIDDINERYDWDIELPYQAIIGGIYATMLEFVVGLLDRIYFHQQMWDYSEEFLNFQGVICLRFSIYWCLLTVLAVLVADFVNYCLYRESQVPYYMIFGRKWKPKIYEILED